MKDRIRITWDTLTRLARPRKADVRDPELLAKTKSKRRHPKRHSTNRERSHQDADNAAKAKLAAQKRNVGRKKHIEQVRAFWRGDRKDHP